MAEHFRPVAGLCFLSALHDTPVVMRVCGELDLCTADDMETALLAVCQPGGVLVLDMSGLAFCDCRGVTVLIRVARRCTEQGGRLAVAAAGGMVAHILSVVDFAAVAPVFASLDEAIRAGRASNDHPPAHAPSTRGATRVVGAGR